MSAKFYPNGIGGSVGDQLDTCKPLGTSGNIWYVSSLIGTDSASPAGQNREKPLASVAQALTNALDDDIIVFLQGHTESIAAGQTISKRLTLVGEGTTSGKPGVSFNSLSAATAIMFTVSTTNVEFRNIYFPTATAATASAKILIASSNTRIVGCYFEQGGNDTGTGILIGSSAQTRIENTTFISTGVFRAVQPGLAIKGNAASSITNLELNGVTVSAGTVGFSNYSAIDLSLAASVLQFKAIGLSLLLGADMALPAGWTGYHNVQLSTGGSRVDAP